MVAEPAALIFTYGTLKRGFSNHHLLVDLIATNDATFLGQYTTREPLPLVCGPYRVPFLLNLPGNGQRVSGELYSVSSYALAKMDDLEGITRGHYERQPILVVNDDGDQVAASAYYGHRSYAEELWRRNGEIGYGAYTEKVMKGYVYRKDRPKNLTFLQQIRFFIDNNNNNNSQDSSPNYTEDSTIIRSS